MEDVADVGAGPRPQNDGTGGVALMGKQSAKDAWVHRRNIAFTLVCWLILLVAALWLAAHIVHALLILLVAALVAYALHPLVERLRRWMPSAAALAIVYLALLAVVLTFGYFVVSTAAAQLVSLVDQIRALLYPTPGSGQSPLLAQLHAWGISQAQIDDARADILSVLQGWTGQIVPVLSGVVNGMLDTVLVVVISIYLLVDGARVSTWANTSTPLRIQGRIQSFLATLQRVIGGYIRGQLALSALVGVLVGIGMLLFHVPYAVLLGVMAFVLEFIPIIGTLTSGAICVLLALSQGWVIALLVLAYFVGVHVVEGDVVGPRIVGKAIGLHPVVSIVALVAGAELFGIWGALLAAPLTGLAQAVLLDAWVEWRKQHPEEFRQAVASGALGAATATAAADTLAANALDGGVHSGYDVAPPIDGDKAEG